MDSKVIVPFLILLCLPASCTQHEESLPNKPADKLVVALANDLRVPGGQLISDVTHLDLIAHPVLWRPELEEGPEIKVYAFSEKGKPPQIPGPLLRVRQGSRVKLTIKNLIQAGEFIGLPPPNRRYQELEPNTQRELVVHGFSRAAENSTEIRILYGETHTLEFTAQSPGRYIYWASTNDQPLFSRTGSDAQLTGLIVVDPINEQTDPRERFFMITMTDAYSDSTRSDPGEDLFERAINGLSWPHTERLRYPKNQTQRWHWFNGSGFEHPMHLHGFHFHTIAREDGENRQFPVKDGVQEVVTELMEPGSSFLMDWTPTRTGNWLMHCHIRDHVIPDPVRSEEERMHDHHDIKQHALRAMAGLIMGITIIDENSDADNQKTMQHLNLVARQAPTSANNTPVRGFALETDNLGAKGPMSVPGPPVVLTRGEMTRISVVNHIDQATSVHWHGLELQSYYDGVPGWSGNEKKVAPMIAPGETFDVYINPPRAGTFIYHTHMDETDQLRSGMYGPLIVLPPAKRFDSEKDKIIIIGDTVDPNDGEYQGVAINGSNSPEPMRIKVGEAYRFRFIDISEAATVDISLKRNNELLSWRATAKDGADLPSALQKVQPAAFRMGTGETYDFTWQPDEHMQVELIVDWPFPTFVGNKIIKQKIHVE